MERGQATSNHFILLDRHMKAGLPISPAIINSILDYHGDTLVTQEILDWFATIQPSTFQYPIPKGHADPKTISELVGPKGKSVARTKPVAPKPI